MREDAVDLGLPLVQVVLAAVEDGAPQADLGAIGDGFLDLGVGRAVRLGERRVRVAQYAQGICAATPSAISSRYFGGISPSGLPELPFMNAQAPACAPSGSKAMNGGTVPSALSISLLAASSASSAEALNGIITPAVYR